MGIAMSYVVNATLDLDFGLKMLRLGHPRPERRRPPPPHTHADEQSTYGSSRSSYVDKVCSQNY